MHLGLRTRSRDRESKEGAGKRLFTVSALIMNRPTTFALTWLLTLKVVHVRCPSCAVTCEARCVEKHKEPENVKKCNYDRVKARVGHFYPRGGLRLNGIQLPELSAWPHSAIRYFLS